MPGGRATNPALDVLRAAGEMGELVRSLDWSATPLGAPENWSPALRAVVPILLANRFPQLLWWGPEYISIYNDAYRPILGRKHPWGLGRPVRDCWSEIWDILKPLIDTPFQGGPATWSEDIELQINRAGFIEETHFTVAYSAVPDDTVPGGIGGVLATVHEITEKVVGQRRITILRDLGACTAEARTAEEACVISAAMLRPHIKDMPFALLYVADASGTQARIAASCGVDECVDMRPPVIRLDDASSEISPWPPIAAAHRTGQMQVVKDLSSRFAALPAGPWPDPPQCAAIVPIRSHVAGQPAGFLIAGLSSRLQFDEGYQNFLELATSQIATAIANAQVYEEERKRAEALAEIDRAKTAFFSNVSHEFRTPLTLMLGPLEDALSNSHGVLPPGAAASLTVSHRNALRLLKLVNTMLDFSRIEAGRTQASYQPTDLASLTTELASNFRSACDRAGLKLVVDCPTLPEAVYVDPGMWEKIVLNLLSNAFKFTFEGGITVRLREARGGVELSVEDTGVGIPKDELPRVFERFHRVAGQQSRSYEGSGIGLALVQELVKFHGGDIHAQSDIGMGTTLTVRIPFGTEHLPKERVNTVESLSSTSIRADAYVEEALHWIVEEPARFDAMPQQVHSSGDVTVLREGTRILLADDNADMRRYVGRLLGSSCEIQTVGDGKEALEAARTRRPDLILTDVMMPNLDGFDLLRAIRSDAALRDIPIIMLSARAGEESRVEGLRAGADDYLVKPFSARELVARVSSLLELTRVRQEALATLRDSERRTRALFQQAPGFICVLSGPRHVFEFVNDSYLHVVGNRDYLGKTVREAVPEAEGQGYFELLDQCYRTGEPFKGIETPIQLRRTPDGPLESMLIDFIYQPITDAGGRVTGIFVEGFDVTARVSAQAALRESESRFRTLFDSIDEGFCIIEALPAEENKLGDYLYIAANPALKIQSGVTVKVGHDTIRGLLSTEAQSWIDVFDEILRTGQPIRGERGLLTQGRVLDLYSFRLEDETKRRIGVIFTDITERKRAEMELLRANQDLEQFAYSASHDLQEPLRTVKIYSQLLAERLGDELDGDARDFLDFLTSGATRMEVLVRDLLVYTQAGQVDRPAVPADAGESLNNALANLAEAIRANGAQVTSEPLPSLRVHPTQLQQLFQNLVGNAIKYCRPGTPPIVNVRVRRDGEVWLFSVTDNGLGIEAEYQERIFGLFKRLHTGAEYSGTGIGLAICQRIVERYHGRIWVESILGKGSTFNFTLPV
jgi:signal transduction histidine kinase/DNA-binding NarL/FixJ family response regulator